MIGLPVDMIVAIMKRMSFYNLYQVSRANRYLRDIIQEHISLKELAQKASVQVIDEFDDASPFLVSVQTHTVMVVDGESYRMSWYLRDCITAMKKVV